jgi:hypothetical protein
MMIRNLDYAFRSPIGCDHRANEQPGIGEALLNLCASFSRLGVAFERAAHA